MKQLKIALTALAAESGISQENWKTVPLKGADLTDVSAVVMTSRDEIPAAYDTIHAFSIPLFILDTGEAASRNMSEISGTLLPIKEKSSWKKRITRAALQYEKDLLPPFFGALMKYTSRKNDEYDSPGHQGGAFFRKHPAGRIFYYYYGPNVFRGDLSSSDVDLGNFLIHEGAALSAQKHAAKVFHADKTYFVLNDILFLLTPAETKEKLQRLVDKLVEFETFIDNDAPMEKVLPKVYEAYETYYKGCTIRRLCQEMHNFYKERNVASLQQQLFTQDHLPPYAMSPRKAEGEYFRGNGELIDLKDAEGRIALEGALPYPPGILCIHPGERWTKTAIHYFMDLIDSINALPGFPPEVQGVYVEDGEDGKKHAYGYVLKE